LDQQQEQLDAKLASEIAARDSVALVGHGPAALRRMPPELRALLLSESRDGGLAGGGLGGVSPEQLERDALRLYQQTNRDSCKEGLQCKR
jgi:hypothetical protein